MKIIYIHETEELNAKKFIAVVKWKQKYNYEFVVYMHLLSNMYVSLTVLIKPLVSDVIP